MESFVFWSLVAVGAICWIIKRINADMERKKAENLRYTDPAVYAQLKQIEHEQRLLEHDEKRMRHDNAQAGAKIVSDIFRIWK